MKRNFTLLTAIASLLTIQSVFAADFIVTTTANSGAGSLRQAVLDASANGTGQDNIFFNLPTSPAVIELTSSLTINTPVFIDGYTQPGAFQGPLGSRQLAVNVSFNPFINGNTNSTVDGFIISSRNVVIRGLAIIRARIGITINGTLSGTGVVKIQGCNIGRSESNGTAVTDEFGDVYNARNASHGISFLTGASTAVVRAYVGVDGDGVNDANEGNLISNNQGDGILVTTASANVIAGNYIGTDITGLAPINVFQTNTNGINLISSNIGAGANNNRIGTNGDGVSDALEGNIISGNRQNGIILQNKANFTTIAGNTIGLGKTGEAAGNGRVVSGVPPTFPLQGNGIVVLNSSNNVIGVDPAAGVAAQGNTISSNFYNGVVVYSNVTQTIGNVTNNSIMGNTIGTGPDKGNGNWGVLFGNSATSNSVFGNFVGSNDDGTNDDIEGNIISFNKADGIGVSESVSTSVADNRFSRNSMFSNVRVGAGNGAGLGINLLATGFTDGTTPNTAGDVGPNYLFNYPVTASFGVDATAQKVIVTGTAPQGSFIQYYRASSDANNDNAAYNEGQTFLFGLTDNGPQDEDANLGAFKFTVDFANLASTIAVGQSVVALAHTTESGAGATSEFSQTSVTIVALPVTFVDFKAELQNDKVLVSWATSFEQNASHFEVERSANGRDFTKIGVVNAKGNASTLSKYSFADASPLAGVSYYRLRQVDLDNRYVYTRTVVIRNQAATSAFSVWPNPVMDNVNITMTSDRNQNLSIRVVDFNGRVVKTQVVNATRGMNQITVNMSSLTKGMYVVQVIGADVNLNEKVIKQ